jgi:hypothetical protein
MSMSNDSEDFNSKKNIDPELIFQKGVLIHGI